MVTLDHLSDFRLVLEHMHRGYLELRLLPSLHYFKVHEDPLAGGVIIDDKDRTSVPLDARKYLMLPHLMIRRQSFLDLGNNLIRILNPDQAPRPFDFESVFHRSYAERSA